MFIMQRLMLIPIRAEKKRYKKGDRMKLFPLAEAGLSFKVLATFLLIAVGVGYVFGLIHIYKDMGFSYTGVVTHYRGEKGAEISKDFAAANLIHLHHIHLFSLSMLFFLVGMIFTLTSLPEIAKAVFVALPYVGMFLDFTSFWLLVFVSPIFAAVAMVMGALMALAFFLLIGRPLYEMWVLPVWQKRWGKVNVPWFLR